MTYKATGKAYFRLRRIASDSVTPVLTPQKENSNATGGGADQLALSDGNITAEMRRQELLKKKADVDLRLSKIKSMISQAKGLNLSYRSSAGADPRLIHKWEMEAADLGHKSQNIQIEVSQLTRLRKIEATLAYEREFISAARIVLHPDIFEKIQRVAHDMSARSLALRGDDPYRGKF